MSTVKTKQSQKCLVNITVAASAKILSASTDYSAIITVDDLK